MINQNHAIICGTGSYSPTKILTNAELEKTIDTNNDWIISRTGIHSRHIAASHETTSFMAGKAAANALIAAEIKADDIDLIIVATCTPDNFFPSVACYVQHELNIKKPLEIGLKLENKLLLSAFFKLVFIVLFRIL